MKNNFKPKISNKNKLDETTFEKPMTAKSISKLYIKNNFKPKISNKNKLDEITFEKPMKAKSISKLYIKNNFKPKISNKNKLDETIFEKPITTKSISKLYIKNNFKPKISNKNKLDETTFEKPMKAKAKIYKYKSANFKKYKSVKPKSSLKDIIKPQFTNKILVKIEKLKEDNYKLDNTKDNFELLMKDSSQKKIHKIHKKYENIKKSKKYISKLDKGNSELFMTDKIKPTFYKKTLAKIEYNRPNLNKHNPLISRNYFSKKNKNVDSYNYNFDFVEKVIYINLESCVNRKILVEKELLKYFPEEKIIRFNAIADTPGAIGCTKSHIAVLEMAIENDWKNCLIVEDDLEWFPDNKIFKKAYNILKRLIKIPFLDVLVLSSYCRINHPISYKLTKCLTTGNYFVKNHYYQTLLNNYKEGLELLIKNKDAHIDIRINYTIDFYWHKLQKIDNWYVVAPSLSVQRTDVSATNGELRVMNRKVYM
jgi:glycosyl transferase family 25